MNKPTAASPFIGATPSDRVHKAAKEIYVTEISRMQ